MVETEETVIHQTLHPRRDQTAGTGSTQRQTTVAVAVAVHRLLAQMAQALQAATEALGQLLTLPAPVSLMQVAVVVGFCLLAPLAQVDREAAATVELMEQTEVQESPIPAVGVVEVDTCCFLVASAAPAAPASSS
jgi:hypothetical protein